MLKKSMNDLLLVHTEKRKTFEDNLAKEIREMKKTFRDDEIKLRKNHEKEFLTILENATRRAIGKVKKCNCAAPYLCCHNKTASYNTV